MACMQDRLGVEITSVIEDASNATTRTIAAEAYAQLAAIKGGESPANTSSATVKSEMWIARAPISIKMRLFCLPYAGGVSENVFGR